MANGTSFDDLVNEAFIKPLRSVLIVDDQYPTWEEIFNTKLEDDDKSGAIEASSRAKSWYQPDTAGEVFSLVKEFRRQNPGLIIDIHDGVVSQFENTTAGNETPQQLADHLHQSDLLVLDYNLEGTNSGTRGDAAIKILSSVLSNHHFNLVVVHTSEDLDDVFHESVISLMQSCSSQFDDKCWEELDNLEKVLQEAEDEDSFDRSALADKFDLASYVGVRASNAYIDRRAIGNFMSKRGGFSALYDWASGIEYANEGVVKKLSKAQLRTFFFWAINEFEKKICEQFSKETIGGLSWKNEGGYRWIRASRGFVCFVGKGPENLINELKNALVDWKPTPSRLLSAKFRDVLSRVGVDVEDKSLSQKHAFAKFYDTILRPTIHDLPGKHISLLRNQRLRDHVSRQSEMLSFLIEEQVVEFGTRIYETDRTLNFPFKNHYDVDLGKPDQNAIAISQYNKHVCCLPSKLPVNGEIENEQLDSGHIFKLGEEWWVCATPACDLQPGQNIIAFSKGNDPSLRPFTALRLHKAPDVKKLSSDHINSGSYCYIEYEGKIISLGTRTPKDDMSKPAEPKVAWRSMVAKNGGVISDGKLELLEIHLELENEVLKSELKEAEVVAKLRYEYALNFIQRVGGSVSRIGLGYVT